MDTGSCKRLVLLLLLLRGASAAPAYGSQAWTPEHFSLCDAALKRPRSATEGPEPPKPENTPIA